MCQCGQGWPNVSTVKTTPTIGGNGGGGGGVGIGGDLKETKQQICERDANQKTHKRKNKNINEICLFLFLCIKFV